MTGGKKISYSEGYKYQVEQDCSAFVGIYSGEETIETDYIKLDGNGFMTVKRGYAWNGASGPTIDTPSTIRGSAFHDATYQLIQLGLLSEYCRKKADENLRSMCIEDGMLSFRADLWYEAVRLCGDDYTTQKPEILEAP
jgi:hypothetical protein